MNVVVRVSSEMVGHSRHGNRNAFASHLRRALSAGFHASDKFRIALRNRGVVPCRL
jgi:hypothetical protein